MSNFITFDTQKNLLHIQFNRPDKMNALNLKMYEQLCEGFDNASNDDDIHAILISSTSEHFTAGNDLGDFLNAVDDLENSSIIQFINMLANFKKPLIAGVKGNAVGIGTTLLLHCDLVYAAPNALFSTPFTKLGLVPEAGASYLLPKLIGNAKAAKMLLLGEPCNAVEAEQTGLISEIYAGVDFDAYILAKAQKLAQLPHQAMLKTKALIKDNHLPLAARMKNEVECFTHLLGQDEFKNIAKAFLSKK